MSARRIRLPSVSPRAFRIKYTATMDMKPGNRPRIIAMFMYGFLIRNLSRERQ